MKKPEITPGKWRSTACFIRPIGGGLVAEARGGTVEQELTNAKAIAALPDLLESMEPIQGINDSRLRSMNADELRELIWETRSLQMLSLTKAGYTFD